MSEPGLPFWPTKRRRAKPHSLPSTDLGVSIGLQTALARGNAVRRSRRLMWPKLANWVRQFSELFHQVGRTTSKAYQADKDVTAYSKECNPMTSYELRHAAVTH